MDLPKRKPIRLKGYDYSQNGAYFITMCTNKRECILSNIVGDDAYIVPKNNLSQIGLICEKYINNINIKYGNVTVDKFVIIPNHIHLFISHHGTMWASSPTKTIGDIIRSFKTLVTKEAGFPIWQRFYHDHIIRGEKDYLKIWEYIDTNVIKWKKDCFYTIDYNPQHH